MFVEFVHRLGDSSQEQLKQAFQVLLHENASLSVALISLYENYERAQCLLSPIQKPSRDRSSSFERYAERVRLAPLDRIGLSALIEQLKAPRAHETYELKEVIARGGMSVVYRAFDLRLHRWIAMKILPVNCNTGHLSDVLARRIGRFFEEAQIAAQLDHPSILPLYDCGIDGEGRAYLAMPLVEGADLGAVTEKLRKEVEGWNLPRALSVLLRVAEALSYAHSRGVVHRDLKPSNVLVGRFGEAYVMDWGLACVQGFHEPGRMDALDTLRSRFSSSEPGSPWLTMDGDVVGTPAYMAPEQANGETERIGPQTDVYAVGALLYHLLTGVPPHGREGLTLREVIEDVRTRPPAPIHPLDPRAPAELVAICERAMAFDPAARYRDCEELRDDLRAYLEQRVVKAYRTGVLAELGTWYRRNRRFAQAVFGLIVTVVIGVVLAAFLRLENLSLLKRSNVDLTQANRSLEGARKESESRLEELRRSQYLSDITVAALHLESSQPAGVRELLDECPVDLRNWEWQFLDKRLDSSTHTFRGHSGVVSCVVVSNDGTWFASLGYDGTVRFWDLKTRTERLCVRVDVDTKEPVELCISPDQSMVLVGATNRVLFLNRLTGETLRELGGHKGLVESIDFSSDRRWLATAAMDKTVLVREGPDYEREVFQVSATRPSCRFSPDSQHLCVSTYGSVSIYETGSWLLRGTVAADGGLMRCSFSSDSDSLVLGSCNSANLFLIDLETPAMRRVIHTRRVTWCNSSFWMNDRLLVSAEDTVLSFYDSETGQAFPQLFGHRQRIGRLVLLPDGLSMLSASADGTIKLWDLTGWPLHYSLGSTLGHVRDVELFGGDSWVAAVSDRETKVRLWSLDPAVADREIPLQGAGFDVDIAPDEGEIAVSCKDGMVRTFALADGTAVRSFRLGTGTSWCVDYSGDGRWLAAGKPGGGIFVLERLTGVVRDLQTGAPPMDLRFDPKGELLLAGCMDGGVDVFGVDGWERRHHFKESGEIRAVAWSPNDSSIVYSVNFSSPELRRVDLKTGKTRWVFHLQEGMVNDMEFSPDGHRLITVSADGGSRVVDFESGQSVLSLFAYHKPISALCISADGMIAARGGEEGTVACLLNPRFPPRHASTLK